MQQLSFLFDVLLMGFLHAILIQRSQFHILRALTQIICILLHFVTVTVMSVSVELILSVDCRSAQPRSSFNSCPQDG